MNLSSISFFFFGGGGGEEGGLQALQIYSKFSCQNCYVEMSRKFKIQFFPNSYSGTKSYLRNSTASKNSTVFFTIKLMPVQVKILFPYMFDIF